MAPTIIYKNASNWVDRGDPPDRRVRQSLAHFFEKFDEADEPWLQQHAITMIGMVEADATEVHLANYLRGVVREVGVPSRGVMGTRLFAIAIWHVAKAALVRDFAERVLRGEVPLNTPTGGKLSDWLAERLFSAEELSAYKDDQINRDE
ncbi:MAG: hypothetical protein ABI120_18385 [Gemmatimonadaceae bacterium]